MNLSAPFIRRPIGTTLLALGIFVAGIVSFNLLPVATLPQVEFPTINVQAGLPGANPEVMATSVAAPLEHQLGRIAGVTEMTSSSILGTTQITLQFDLSRDIDGAARDVQAAINAARGQLPANLPNNPTYRKVNPSEAPVMILTLSSQIYPPGEMYNLASTLLQQKLSQINGVGQVFVGGSSLPGVRVELNPTALNHYGIGLTNVADTLAASNVNQAKGQLSNGTTTSQITTNDQLFKADDYRSLIIAYRNNNPVKLSDVAQVNEGVENMRTAGLANGEPAVVIVLYKEPGANVIKTIDQVRKVLPQLKALVPQAMTLNVALDRTATIRSSLHDVEITLLIAVILVILVAYFFLGSVRAMLIPGAAVIVSLLGTFCVMILLGYSLDNLSLMALTIATGFVVDDAVVVLENIDRHIEAGMKPFAAALTGAQEVGFTVLSMSISLIAAFVPILLMEGIVGRLFREFAITLAVAIIVSLLISLTVTPMMCAYLLTAAEPENTTRFTRFLATVKDHYRHSLRWSLTHQYWVLLILLATLGFNIFLFLVIPKGFFPQQDTGRITASIQAEQDISFQAMREKLAEFVHRVHDDPAVDNVVGFVGSAANSGSLFVTLKPLMERKISVDQVIGRLRKKLSSILGATLYMQAAQDLVIGGRQGNAQFQYTLSSNNLQDLTIWTPQVKTQLAKLPGIADVNSDQLSNGLQVFVSIDHDAASRFGITTEQIDAVLYSAFGQRQVSTFYTAMNQYHVIMEVAPPYWQNPDTLKQIYVTSATGNEVPLSAFATFTPAATLLSVTHAGQAPAATLSFNLLPNVALGDAVNEVNQAMKKMRLPLGMHGAFHGSAQAFQASLANEPYLILAALIAVYIVLGILYESLIHPVTILSTLPSAGVGALLALLLAGTEFSIIALIGIILLIGIVKKNAIMMIDVALHLERTENAAPQDAIFEAAVLRFRPIMMTTAAAILGALPLVFGFGLGAELRRPLGIAIVGGLIVSQMLTLYTTPVIYLLLERSRQWWQRKNAFTFVNVD